MNENHPSSSSSDELNNIPHEDSLEYFISDTSKVSAIYKNRYILGAFYSVVPGFTLKTGIYNKLKKGQMPTQAMLKNQILRRDSSFKHL